MIMTPMLPEPAGLPEDIAGTSMVLEVPKIISYKLDIPKLDADGSTICEDPAWRSAIEDLYQALDSVQAVRCQVSGVFMRLLEAAEAFFEQPSKQQYAPYAMQLPTLAVAVSVCVSCVIPSLQVLQLFWRLWLPKPWP